MKLVSVMLILIIVASMLGGCGADFDARRYVQGMLDCYIKGEFEDYQFMTDATEEEARIEYDSYYSFVEASYEGFQLTDDSVLDELAIAYKELYQSARYAANEAVKNEDGSYSVEVDISPLTVVTEYNENIYNERLAEIEEPFFAEIENGVEHTQAEYDQLVVELDLQLVKEMIDNVTYGDPMSITVTVFEDESDGLYYLSDEDFWKLDAAIFNY